MNSLAYSISTISTDTAIVINQDEKPEQLHFPPFHQEILTQVWANPAQGMGTIRVVVAEGIDQGQASSASFIKLRNIVTFSFQHAPLRKYTLIRLRIDAANKRVDILENCAIAWPNPGMWWQGQQQFHNHSVQPTESADSEAHAHSPRRQQALKEKVDDQPDSNEAVAQPISQGLIAHPALRAAGTLGNDPFWSQHGPMHDPFSGATTSNSFYRTVATCHTGGPSRPESRSTSSSHDESMPDYSRPLSPASSRRSYLMPDYSRPPTIPGTRDPSDLTSPAVNDFGLTRLDSLLQSHHDQETESQFNDLIAAFSPRKHSNNSGISAPSNTRVNSAANTPLLKSDGISAAAKTRASSYSGHPRSVSVTTRDPHLPPSSIQFSRNGSKSSSSAPITVIADNNHETKDTKDQPETVIKRKPVGRPKGRKEGKTSEAGGLEGPINKVQRSSTMGSSSTQGKENTAMGADTTSDGKRKRVSNATVSQIALEDRLPTYDTWSPTRKVSKVGPQGSPSKKMVDLDDLTPEGVVTRAPLGELENCL